MTTAVVEVAVERADDGALVVSWQLQGPPVAVDVAVGPTPDHVDHAHHLSVGPGVDQARISGLGPGRHYVSVSPAGGGPAVVAGERRVPFEGVTNFRDLGGYRTGDGGRTRWGLVFRADALHRFTTEDLAQYEHLGMRAVYDLRGELERARFPNPVPSVAAALLSRPADAPAASVPETTAADGERRLRDMYVGILDHGGDVIGTLLTALIEPEGLPAVFHCAGGKDRTGMSAALLLELLGVARDDVLDDYELTSRYRFRHHQQDAYDNLLALGLGPEAAASVLGTPRWAMEEALAELDARYGGVEAYLTGPARMGPGDLALLRERLVDR